MPEEQIDEQTEEIQLTILDKLNAVVQLNNIAQGLQELSGEDEILTEIGTRVLEDYRIDKDSREDWEESNKEIFKLASQIGENRTYAGKSISNVRYPIIANAAMQFSARAYPNIVQGADVVKCQVIGSDPDGIKAAKGKRVQQHMSYQVLEQMESWEEEMDQLLITLALVGCEFKKTYYDPVKKRNVSTRVPAENLVVHYKAKSLETAKRVTEIIELYPNDIEERIRSGVFLDFDYEKAGAGDDDNEAQDENDNELPHVFLEQHRWWDLDDDGYQEPYVVTVHKKSEQVVRIVARFDIENVESNENDEVARIEPNHYYTQYSFLPAFDGNFYKMGFGALLASPVNIVNTIFNQILDAGTLANRQGGFIGQGIKLGKDRTIKFEQGEWKQVAFMGDDIKKNILPLPVAGPSNVLFQLLGLLLEAIKELASQAEVLSGEQPQANVPATTTLALIEQGLKVFSAIYKRIYRSLKSEFKKLRRLNTMYLTAEEYNNIIDYTEKVQDEQTGAIIDAQITVDPREDYSEQWMDIIPVSGSADVSDTQRVIKAQALLEMRGQGLNDDEINRRYLEALQVPDFSELLPEEDAEPQVDPKYVIEEEKLRLKNIELQLDAKRQMVEQTEKMSKVMYNWAQSIKALADAEAAEAGPQLERYKLEVQEFQSTLQFYGNLLGQLGGQNENDQGATQSVAKSP
jgi:chaperonin GroES